MAGLRDRGRGPGRGIPWRPAGVARRTGFRECACRAGRCAAGAALSSFHPRRRRQVPGLRGPARSGRAGRAAGPRRRPVGDRGGVRQRCLSRHGLHDRRPRAAVHGVDRRGRPPRRFPVAHRPAGTGGGAGRHAYGPVLWPGSIQSQGTAAGRRRRRQHLAGPAARRGFGRRRAVEQGAVGPPGRSPGGRRRHGVRPAGRRASSGGAPGLPRRDAGFLRSHPAGRHGVLVGVRGRPGRAEPGSSHDGGGRGGRPAAPVTGRHPTRVPRYTAAAPGQREDRGDGHCRPPTVGDRPARRAHRHGPGFPGRLHHSPAKALAGRGNPPAAGPGRGAQPHPGVLRGNKGRRTEPSRRTPRTTGGRRRLPVPRDA